MAVRSRAPPPERSVDGGADPVGADPRSPLPASVGEGRKRAGGLGLGLCGLLQAHALEASYSAFLEGNEKLAGTGCLNERSGRKGARKKCRKIGGK